MEAEKDIVEGYLRKHNIERSLNAAINTIVKDCPEDPFSVLSDILKQQSNAGKGILDVEVFQVLDGKGRPTLQVAITTTKGTFEACVSADVPGVYDPAPEDMPEEGVLPYGGKSVLQTAESLTNTLHSELEGMDPHDQRKIDQLLQGMATQLGSNVILAVSLAVCKAGAKHNDIELYEHIANIGDFSVESACIPTPIVSLLNGGVYGGNPLLMRDIAALPLNAESFAMAQQVMFELTCVTKELLAAKDQENLDIGTFGGFSAHLQSVEEALQVVAEAIKTTKSRVEGCPDIGIVVDVGGADFYVPPKADDDLAGVHFYNLEKWMPKSKGTTKTSDDLVDLISSWHGAFDVMSVLDPFDSSDLPAFGKINSMINAAEQSPENKESIGGDASCVMQVAVHDAFHNNLESLSQENACNTVIVDLSKCITVTDAVSKVSEVRNKGLSVVIGCKDGETAETFAADFAVGVGAGQVKFGGLQNAYGTLKYNRLSIIAQRYSPTFIGSDFRR